MMKKLDPSKQMTAVMPNLIHSWDASSISLLWNIYKENFNVRPSMYTVHDCYAVSADKIALLIESLITVYI